MGQLRQWGRFWSAFAALLVAAVGVHCAVAHAEPTVEELKARLSSTSLRDRPHLCVHIAELQMDEADKLYASDDVTKAQNALGDVVAYSELARDYAIQTHKYQKQTEIAVRGITRRLAELAHSLPHNYQAPLHDALNRLQKVRDDLLAAMFPQGAK